MNKDKIRALLNEFFKARDLDADVEKLYPLMDKKRLHAILNEGADFNKADMLLMMSVAMEVKAGMRMQIDSRTGDLLKKIKDEMGGIQMTPTGIE
jgi:hypothetical protein